MASSGVASDRRQVAHLAAFARLVLLIEVQAHSWYSEG